MTTSPAPAAPPSIREGTPLSWRLALVAGIVAVGLGAYLARAVIGLQGQAACGVVCFLGLAALASCDLRAVNWRTVAAGLALQLLLALFILEFEVLGYRPGYRLFEALGSVVRRFLTFTEVGADFVFGPLARPQEMGKVFPERGFVFAFAALPTIIFVSSFFTVLYHFGVLQFIVRVMARVMMRVMGTSGAESLSAAANVFMGQTEAPLIVKPYVAAMTRSELLALMVGGMATISGGLMAVYIEMGADPVAILATSVMAAPCSLYLAKLILPERETPATHGQAKITSERPHRNAIDAAAAGASDGLYLALNVAAMLIAFLALIALCDALLGGLKPALHGAGLSADALAFLPDDLSLKWIFGRVFAPVAFLMGVAEPDLLKVGNLLGLKLVANEFVAYKELTGNYRELLSPRSYTLTTYALTGFANFASIGIQIGGIGALAPGRRGDLAQLGTRALLAGFLATLLNAALAGMLM